MNNHLENTIKEETSREIVNYYNDIRSYMFWGGFMNMSDYECNKFLFKELNLEKYCPKKSVITIKIVIDMQNFLRNTKIMKNYYHILLTY